MVVDTIKIANKTFNTQTNAETNYLRKTKNKTLFKMYNNRQIN